MKKKNPELDFSPQANMLHLLKSAKSMALSSPKRNTVLVQPSILDVMTGKGTITLCGVYYKTPTEHTYRGYPAFSTQCADLKVTPFTLLWIVIESTVYIYISSPRD